MSRIQKAIGVGLLVLSAWQPVVSGRIEAQDAGPSSPVLVRVAGEVPRVLELRGDALARLPRQAVRVKDPGGKEVAYEGIPVVEVLKEAGIKFGHDLRGSALATYLIVEAADGYRVVFALPELEPASADRVILLADRREDRPLDEKDGPLRVIVPGEKQHSRWVKRVVALKIGRS